MVLAHQEDYIEIIREFNDCLRDALKEMYDRAHRIYQDAIKHQDDGGISQFTLPQGAYADSFEAYTGMNDSSSNIIEDFNPELTKDLNLTNQFLHLYRHTDFALTDFIFVRDFYSEINVSITKRY